jgi:hypothetical protein
VLARLESRREVGLDRRLATVLVSNDPGARRFMNRKKDPALSDQSR